ncbi:TetR family transcriptional regulator [Jatrophihabitans sp. GAS493]|uniref:TetR/AcrR family transcriptional regulator n=1 Tax=Jatrophihabitans sp. GAS493 TaxID=1907575 RepID=UPI000BB732FD|nr:TetR/AcrR family transcriptional regulator [Jatrophihabitans sp. GAS493]SOD71089.1 TetR family transcriptional regulator [Jatrophihabitans sp. GAS493]
MSESSPLPPAPRRPDRLGRVDRKPALSVDVIVQAGIDVLDEGGADALSMRRVAERLGTGAASLYAYVRNKDELLELMYDELISRVPIPTPDPARWREQIREVIGGMRRMLQDHAEVAMAGAGRVPMSEKGLAGAEGVTALLNAGGLPPRIVGMAADLIGLYITAIAFEESTFSRSGMDPETAAEYFTRVHEFYVALPADRYPVMAMLGSALTGPDGDERFAFGLDVILAGLVALADDPCWA